MYANQHIAMDDYIITKDGATCWHYAKTPFTSEFAEKAEKELNEKPEERAAAIEKFRQRIKEKADFKSRLDEIHLLRFLRPRKFNEDRAFRLLRNYYWAIAKYTDISGEIRPSVIEDKIMQFSSLVLPYRDPEGRPILVLRMCEWRNDRTPFKIVLRMIGLAQEIITQDPVTQVSGIVAILDWRNAGLKVLIDSMTPHNLYIAFTLLQDCVPFRVRAVHIVYESAIFKASYNIAKLFIRAKLRNRVMLHGSDMSSFHKYIPPEILPEEYGGTLQVDNSEWARTLFSKEDEFLDVLNYGFVNSKST